MPNIPHRAPFVMLLAGLSPFVLDSRYLPQAYYE